MFKVIRSSAGAGKTHALVKHYLGHCLGTSNATAYRQVLALTFTNKAASEMRERAVEYLRKLSALDLEQGHMADVMQALEQGTGATPQEIARRADAVLRHMLHHYGDVAISTIDAFTRRVARPFARDLRLDQALHMSTDADWYHGQAVDALIAEAGTHAEVTKLLVQACEQLLEDEKKWDPATSLRELIKVLDQERSIKPLEALSRLDANSAIQLTKKLREESMAEREKIRAAGRAAVQFMQSVGVADDAWAEGARGIPSYLRKIAAFDGAWLEEGKSAMKAIAKDDLFSGKADADARSLIGSAAQDMKRHFAHAHETLHSGQRRYFLLRAIRRELPTTFALHELSRHLEQLKHDDGVAFFSDLTRRVAEVVRDEPAPWIFERVGERYMHFLIDEFQDTSLLQWECLLPLIDNALSKGGSAFIVGDAKQAIYRWRNGEAQLLMRFPELHGRTDSKTDRERADVIKRNYKEGDRLVANRRSSATIVQFNNALFNALPAILPERLRVAYAGQEQEVHRTDEGLVHVEVLPKEVVGHEADEATARFLAARVAECLADGYQPSDIAVLVRSKSVGQRCVETLKAHGHSVSSPDGGKLASSASAQLIIDLLRVLHTHDECAAARALQRMAQLIAPPEAIAVDPFPDSRKGIANQRIGQWLRDHGHPALRTTLSALMETLANALGIDPAHDGQLLALIDEAHDFGLQHGQDIAAFLEHWDRKGGERASATAPQGAIQVMTIHKAKGLEFPVVIVPSTQMRSNGRNTERLWIDGSEASHELPYALVAAGGALQSAGIPELDEEEELKQLDEINLLYVAFTRPKERLYVWARAYRADAVTKSLMAWLEAQQSHGAYQSGKRLEPWKRSAEALPVALRSSANHAGTDLPLRFEAPEDWDPADTDPMRRHGILVHEALSRVLVATDLPHAVDAMLREGAIDRDEAAMLRERIEPLLRSPTIAEWFTPGMHVRTEATLITADGHALRPDRVVIDGEAVRVLDYKTGAPNERHHAQVRGYLHVLRAIGHKQVEGALLYTGTGELQIVEPA
ncbi:MAG TPA: UvrD-helicase domain-containing protein [Flavobacteriales bacterium]|nr:UvrD-helicase domain-containing protein [Flavobacteriales bacterium]